MPASVLAFGAGKKLRSIFIYSLQIYNWQFWPWNQAKVIQFISIRGNNCSNTLKLSIEGAC